MALVIAALVGTLSAPLPADVPHLEAAFAVVEEKAAAPLTIERLPLIARKVAYCESRYVNTASPATSTASGYFQFLNGTWEWVTGLPAPASAYPLEVQYAAFLELWDEGRGASHWNPSRYCWETENPWATY